MEETKQNCRTGYRTQYKNENEPNNDNESTNYPKPLSREEQLLVDKYPDIRKYDNLPYLSQEGLDKYVEKQYGYVASEFQPQVYQWLIKSLVPYDMAIAKYFSQYNECLRQKMSELKTNIRNETNNITNIYSVNNYTDYLTRKLLETKKNNNNSDNNSDNKPNTKNFLNTLDNATFPKPVTNLRKMRLF